MHADLHLERPRLLLRSMTEGDTAALLAIFTDPLVMASFGGDLFDAGQMRDWVQRNLDHQARHGYGLFVVILKREDRLIGNCGLEHMTIDEQPEVEIGYDFRSDYWCQGYATEAAAAVRDFAFGHLELPRLIALIRPANVASRRVAEKIGMTNEREIQRGGHPYWIHAIANPGRDPGKVRELGSAPEDQFSAQVTGGRRGAEGDQVENEAGHTADSPQHQQEGYPQDGSAADHLGGDRPGHRALEVHTPVKGTCQQHKRHGQQDRNQIVVCRRLQIRQTKNERQKKEDDRNGKHAVGEMHRDRMEAERRQTRQHAARLGRVLHDLFKRLSPGAANGARLGRLDAGVNIPADCTLPLLHDHPVFLSAGPAQDRS